MLSMLLCAQIAKAAFSIKGQMPHTVFHFPINCNKVTQMSAMYKAVQPPSLDKLN